MVKIGFWNLYAVQRVGEWVGMSLLSVPFIILDRGGQFISEQLRNPLGIIASAFIMWGVVFVVSGWLLVSLLSFFLYRRFKCPRTYALSSTTFSAFWSGLWLLFLWLVSPAGFVAPTLIILAILWLLGLTSNYFVALWTHRWLIRWPDPVAA
ncbi:hypothetical protein ACFELO_08365 [Oceanicaulis sp. LC35]|uniref:hypothetical protein n=1 Tax=Oceanicaulis sp. LC35 TaxID=3349635 RepID=UPI003F82B2DC